ncbi:RNA polymerase-associated protein CTR9-like protein [Frankliniella fusca]|uniref:RNA polymerase-associated protein CTR9-like protein n=1 Tax=Frankliniella fusca TaxID=407009 RepID=A0AAE1HA91_9NEOP|nr:RNA polymerase-associated protein CTR9-like protein [Frankliniella fusca]
MSSPELTPPSSPSHQFISPASSHLLNSSLSVRSCLSNTDNDTQSSKSSASPQPKRRKVECNQVSRTTLIRRLCFDNGHAIDSDSDSDETVRMTQSKDMHVEGGKQHAFTLHGDLLDTSPVTSSGSSQSDSNSESEGEGSEHENISSGSEYGCLSEDSATGNGYSSSAGSDNESDNDDLLFEAALRNGTRMNVQGNLAELRRKSRKGVIGKAVVCDLPYFDRATAVCGEYMHVVLLGVVDYWLDILFHEKGPWNIGKHIKDIDSQ